MAADANKIYVADIANHRIQIFNATTYAYLATIGGTQGTGNNQFSYPIDVDVDNIGNIYVADIDNFRIQKFNSSYAHASTIGTTSVPYITTANQYNAPFQLDVTADGGIVMAEANGHRVIKLNADGSQAWAKGTAGIAGSDNDHFSNPHGVAVAGDGRIYITDSSNHRVVVLAANGNTLSTFGSWGTTDNDHLNWPVGITVDDSGKIYVVDTNNSRVQIFDNNWNYLATLGTAGQAGSDNAHFSYPIGVAVDNSGNIYVTDVDNHRVQVFNSSYAYQSTLGVTGDCGDYNAQDRLCAPHDVAFDGDGHLYIMDTWHDRVKVFDTAGNSLTSIGGSWGGQQGSVQGCVWHCRC